MIYHLHRVAIRITAIKTTRPVTVRAWRRLHFDAGGLQVFKPCINLLRDGNEKPDMVQPLPVLRWCGSGTV